MKSGGAQQPEPHLTLELEMAPFTKISQTAHNISSPSFSPVWPTPSIVVATKMDRLGS